MNVPPKLASLRQWVLWRLKERGGKPNKVPYQTNGALARANDPETWAHLAEVRDAYDPQRDSGIGFVFSPDDNFVGIDLDDCRDERTGKIQPWAKRIIDQFKTYTEVSPSGTGVKMWCEGKLPISDTGKKKKFAGGAVEMYQHGRYFAFTGEQIGKHDIAPRESEVYRLWNRVFDPNNSVEVVWEELSQIEDSVAGAGGSDRFFHACCEAFRSGLPEEDVLDLIHRWNLEKCSPPWEGSELEHKINDARKATRDDSGLLESRPNALNFISWHTFDRMEWPNTFLIRNVLRDNQPFMIAGESKSLKTSIALDMCVSLATQTPFLGKFDVPESVPVAICSSESSGDKIQDTLRAIAKAKGVSPADIVNKLYISEISPKLGYKGQLEILREALRLLDIRVCIIDPGYKSFKPRDASHATNVFEMGELLDAYASIGRELGCTMGIVHHFTKGSRIPKKRPQDHEVVTPTLDAMAYSGFSEWTRQWILMGKCDHMRAGRHDLCMAVGGSARHNGRYRLDVFEGTDPEQPMLWEVNVTDLDTVVPLPDTEDLTYDGIFD